MSFVTSAVLMVDSASADLRSAILNTRLDDGHPEQFFSEIDMDKAGGYKFMEVDVFAGGFNYVSGDSLRDWFERLPWSQYDRAHLAWETNGESGGAVSRGWAK